jgi:hypothetical protein
MLPIFFDGVDPELQGQVLALRVAEVRTQFRRITIALEFSSQSKSASEQNKIHQRAAFVSIEAPSDSISRSAATTANPSSLICASSSTTWMVGLSEVFKARR